MADQTSPQVKGERDDSALNEFVHLLSNDVCPSCRGDLDTGWECGDCGKDWQSFVRTIEDAKNFNASNAELIKLRADLFALGVCTWDIAKALRYSRRFLNPTDHDTAYVDGVIAAYDRVVGK